MHEVYSDTYQIAIEKIAEFGMDIAITQGPFVYNPVKGERTGSTTTITRKGLKMTDFSRLISDFRIIGNASTMKVDVGIMFGGDVELHDDDVMEVEGVKYTIVQIKHVAPAGVNILQYALGRV